MSRDRSSRPDEQLPQHAAGTALSTATARLILLSALGDVADALLSPGAGSPDPLGIKHRSTCAAPASARESAVGGCHDRSDADLVPRAPSCGRSVQPIWMKDIYAK